MEKWTNLKGKIFIPPKQKLKYEMALIVTFFSLSTEMVFHAFIYTYKFIAS